MAHNKYYAICESKCKVETLSKETLDYRYSQTDSRLMKINSSMSVIANDIETLKTKVAKSESNFLNFYITEYPDLKFQISKIESSLEELKADLTKVSSEFPDLVFKVNSLEKEIENSNSEIKKLKDCTTNFLTEEFPDLVFKVNSLEKRIEALENA